MTTRPVLIQLGNIIITMMMAKFFINDLPHAFKSSAKTDSWEIGIERYMLGTDLIPGIYSADQVPRKVLELMVIAPDVRAMHISRAVDLETKRPGPLLPTTPKLKETVRLWVVDIVGAIGSRRAVTQRAFLVPGVVRDYMQILGRDETIRLYSQD